MMVESRVPPLERSRVRVLSAAWRKTWADRRDAPLAELLQDDLAARLDAAIASEGIEGTAEHGSKGDFTAITFQVEVPIDPRELKRPLELLQSLKWNRDIIDRAMEELVLECRRRDYSWQDIASALDVARQSAWTKYASLENLD